MDCSSDSARRVEEACPDRSVLERLLLGLVSGKEVGPLEEHVHDCAECAAVMGTIQAADPLVEAVRALPRTTEEPDDTQVEALVEALCKLPVTVGSSGRRPSLAETAEQLAPFLDPPEAPGELGRFGPYRVIRILGSGGMGIALEAEEPDLDRRVALKLMNPALAASRSARERFLREARTAASIEHDNVVAIHRVGEHRDLPFLAMPLLKGESLADRLRSRGQLEPSEVVEIGRQIAAALAAAHQQGVVHRDVKPDNVWLEAEPNQDRVKILDFGLARAVDDDVRITRQGVIAGTPAYMAPEQAHGDPVDERADLFSLGCVLYEMCTGRAPFTGSTTASLLLAVTRHQPVAPHRLDRRVPKAISELIMKLLKKDPARRLQTAQEVLDFLQRCPQSSEASAGWRLKTLLITLAAVGAGIGLLAVTVIYLGTGEGLVVLPMDSADVTVTVDGKEARVQREDGMLVVVVPSGKRRIAVSKHGSAPHVEQLWVFRGGRRVLAVDLHPAKLPQQPSGRGKTETAPALAVAPFDVSQAKRHQQAWADYLRVPVETTNPIGVKLVLIPPGEFEMGSSQEELDQLVQEATERGASQFLIDRLPNEGPRHRVRLTEPFYMAIHEVTRAEYRQVMGADPSWFEAAGDRAPVETVSWDEAQAFCDHLSELPEEKAAGRSYNLPTESQWEYACRAGAPGRFAFGSAARLEEYAWFGGNSAGRTHAVGGMKPNAWGLRDMLGNVWEWCHDDYVRYGYAPLAVHAFTHPANKPPKVLRGGSWAEAQPDYFRSAHRYSFHAPFRCRGIGFRVVAIPAVAGTRADR